MKDKEFQDIEKDFYKAVMFAREKFPENDIIPINSFLPADVGNRRIKVPALDSLGRSLCLLATADIIYFNDGWKEARGCRIEHTCAEEYGIKIIHD